MHKLVLLGSYNHLQGILVSKFGTYTSCLKLHRKVCGRAKSWIWSSTGAADLPNYWPVLASSSAATEESLRIYYNLKFRSIVFPWFLGLCAGGTVTICKHLFILLSKREIADCRCLANFIWFEFRDPSPRYLAWRKLSKHCHLQLRTAVPFKTLESCMVQSHQNRTFSPSSPNSWFSF